MRRLVYLLLLWALPLAAADLPDGYVAVDYLESGGGQHIDTGVQPTDRTTLEMKVRTPLPTADCYFYGAMKTFKTDAFACSEDAAGVFRIQRGSEPFLKFTAAHAADFTVRHTPSGFYCDGVCITNWATSAFTAPVNLYLFSMNSSSGRSTTAPPAMGSRLYYAKIWRGSTLVRDFVPVRRVSDGAGGLYDCVSGGFFAGANPEADPFEPVIEAERTAGVEIVGADRPLIGQPLAASVTNGTDCSFVWARKAAGEAARETVATAATYVPTDADREHWLIVSAVSNGLTVGRNQIWISDLPVVYIETDGAARIADRETRHGARLRIQGNAAFPQQYDGRMEIKGRGNSSWVYAQKPYKLKLDAKTDLFGFGKNKHWVLVSNYQDNGMLRNRHGSELAKALGIPGMDMTWVTVILNGVYYGVEMFAEHIRIDKNRVDVFDWEKKGEDLADALYAAAKDEALWKKSDKSALEELMSTNLVWIDTGAVDYGGRAWRLADYGLAEEWDLSGGYLYEMEGRLDGISTFRTDRLGTAVIFNRPEYADTSSALASAGRRLWNEFESAYLAPDGYATNSVGAARHYSEIADVGSMAAYWLTLECLGNYDAHRYSRYSYVDTGGKLKFGPVWDFDYGGASIGVTSVGEAADPDHWAICHISNAQTGELAGTNFFCEWLDDPVFVFKAYDLYWRTVRPWLAAELASGGGIDVKTNGLAKAAAAHDTVFGQRGFARDIRYYRDYLTKRLAWLDRQFASVDTLVASVRNETSACPYAKADEAVAFGFAHAEEAHVVSATDFAWTAADLRLTVETFLSDAAYVDVAVNGMCHGRLALTNGQCSLTLPAAAMAAWASNRVMVTAIVRDAADGVLARNYATVEVTGPSPVTVVTDRAGRETVLEDATPAAEVIAGLRSGGKAVVCGATEAVADNVAHEVVIDGVACPIRAYYDAAVTGVQIALDFNEAARPTLEESEPGKGDQLVVTDEAVTLGVQTQAGLTYTLQRAAAPDGAEGWQSVETVTGDGSVKRLSSPVESGSGFFRVMAED